MLGERHGNGRPENDKGQDVSSPGRTGSKSRVGLNALYGERRSLAIEMECGEVRGPSRDDDPWTMVHAAPLAIDYLDHPLARR